MIVQKRTYIQNRTYRNPIYTQTTLFILNKSGISIIK
jgi:hypothetical protein